MSRPAPSFLDDGDLQLLIFGGKGGVGKTTCASAAAVELAQRCPASSFLLVSTDPAHSLMDSLADWHPPDNLKVLEMDAREYLAAFKKNCGDKLREIASRGTFLADDEISHFLDLSLPGLDELMAFVEISAWTENRNYDCIIVDTAPSGHTLRLLAMPEFLRKWLNMLETLLAKHRYMKWAFTGSNYRDQLDTFLEDWAASVKRMEELLRDSARCRFVPVMLAEAMSVRETVSMVKEVENLRLPMHDVVINQLYPDNSCAVCRGERFHQMQELRNLFTRAPLRRLALWIVPLYAEEVRGKEALESFWDGVERITQAPPAECEPPAVQALKVEGATPWPPPDATLVIFAGKGGVGKTTLACATALQLARNTPGKSVLLFSTGPAHSLAGCLETPIDSRPRVVFPHLAAMEVDAQAEFEALKKQYAADIEKFLESVSSNLDLTFDREVLERILDLSPPGLDEVMALTRVTALLASGRYDVLVLDSASTGHLIRLLELPEIIDQWLRLFFNLCLKYQQIFRLSRFAEELVTMSKNLKRLRGLLPNPARTALYAVSIPTQMALEETRDLVAACERLGIDVRGLLLNLVTPRSHCGLCSALYLRESLVRNKFQRSFPDLDISVVYRHGEMHGLRRLGELGKALYRGSRTELSAYVC